MYILDLLNKIKWDKKENPGDYTIVYIDTMEYKEKEIRYIDIKRIEEPFFIIDTKYGEVNIPLHRIKQVKKKGIVVWER